MYSVRLFRASQTAKEIARQAALLQRWARMRDYARRREGAPTAESRRYGAFADALITRIVAECTELTDEVRTGTPPAAVAFRQEVRALMQRHEVSARDRA